MPQALCGMPPGQEIEITEMATEFYNERQKVQIDLSKIMEQDETFGIGNNGEILSVQFGLFAAEDIVAGDGSVIPKDGLIETVTCDENSYAVFTTDLPRIAMKQENDAAMLIIRNISQEDLPEGADFTERFFRGDVNRSSEGSGLGLSIAKSFTEACGGSFTVETQEDVFTVLIAFPIVSPPEETFLASASGDEEREILQPGPSN